MSKRFSRVVDCGPSFPHISVEVPEEDTPSFVRVKLLNGRTLLNKEQVINLIETLMDAQVATGAG